MENKRNMEIAVECYIKKDDKYLMLKRAPDKKVLPNVWMAPGGKLDFKEGLYACARREVKEETGLDIKNIRLMCFGNTFLKDINTEMFFFILESEYAAGEVLKNPKDGELHWLTIEEILNLENLLAELKIILPKALINKEPVFSCTSVYEKGNEMSELKFEES